MTCPPSPQDVGPHVLGQEMEEMAALYALGLLSGEECAAMETLIRGGCSHLAESVRAARATLGAFALVVPAADASRELRGRLLGSIGRVWAGTPFLVRRSGDLDWQPTAHAGVTKKLLYSDVASGLDTLLIRMLPGSRISPHSHSRAEQCLILEGDAAWNGIEFGPGDFLVGFPHEQLPEFTTRQGNLLLIVGSPEPSSLLPQHL